MENIRDYGSRYPALFVLEVGFRLINGVIRGPIEKFCGHRISSPSMNQEKQETEEKIESY
jgi:hypothetical protein